MTNNTVIARSQPKQSRADQNGMVTLVVRLARNDAGRCLAALAGFFISFQTIWILRPGVLGGVPWPLATIGIQFVDIVFIIAAAVGFLRILSPPTPPSPWDGEGGKGGRGAHRRRSIVGLSLLVVFACLNTLVSADPLLSMVGWLRLIAFLLALAGIPSWSASARRAFLGGFLAAMLIHIGFGVAQFAMLESPSSTLLGISTHAAWIRGDAVIGTSDGRWLRAYGGFPHPNVFGIALLISISVLAPLKVTRRSEAWRYVAAAIATSVFVLTFSRAALLGLAVLVALLVVCRWSRVLAMVVAATAIATVAATWPLWTPRLVVSGPLESRSIEDRWIAFSDARTLLSHPSYLLTGVGLHGMPAAILPGVDTSRNPYMAQPVHNVPLLAFVEGGVLLGCAVLAIVIVLAFRHPLLFVLLPPLLLDHHLWSLPIGLALLFVLVLVHAAGDPRIDT